MRKHTINEALCQSSSLITQHKITQNEFALLLKKDEPNINIIRKFYINNVSCTDDCILI